MMHNHVTVNSLKDLEIYKNVSDTAISSYIWCYNYPSSNANLKAVFSHCYHEVYPLTKFPCISIK